MKERFSISSFVIGLLLGALSMVLWYTKPEPFSTSSPLTPTASKTTSSKGAPTYRTSPPADSGAVSVVNQAAGNTVMVASVTVPPPGVWVAVREVSNASLGNVLGAARVTGPRSNVTVPLLRATVPGASYAIELYRDSGNDRFDLSTDSVYVDFDTGEPVIAYFQTTASTTPQ